MRPSPGAANVVAGLLIACGAGCAPSYDSVEIDDSREDLATERTAEAGDAQRHRLRGEASWYGADFQGELTASGEPYDMYGFTAAHKSLPFHTLVRVVHPKTRKSVVVRINDRGPYAEDRIIDLSWAAARDLGMSRRGTVPVRLEVLEWGDGSRVSAEE